MLLDLNRLHGPRQHVERTVQPSDLGPADPDYVVAAPVELVMDVSKVSADTFEANGLIDDRTFSWTVFFGQLEKTLPYDVRLIQVAPRWEREVFGINMIVNVKRREDLSAFLDALQSTQSFYDVFASEQQAMEDGTYNATVEGGYIAPGKPTKASGAPGGSQRP